MGRIDMNKPLKPGLDPAAWLAAIVEGSEDAIVSKALDGTVLSWNAGAQKLFGYTPEEMVGASITVIIPADRLHEEEAIIARIKAGERTEHFETVRRRKDGSLVDVSLTVSPVRDAQGKLLGASKVARDISQSRQMAEKQNLLLREMNHRIKNLFALASGLVSLCGRGADSVEKLMQDLQGRLVALARAHDTTLTGLGENFVPASVSLGNLLETILKPYDGKMGPTIQVADAATLVGPHSLTSLALLLHELATNSAKYGALHTTRGRLYVEVCEQDGEVCLRWEEAGLDDGISPPSTTGFGSRLEAMAIKDLGGHISREWGAGRLLIELRFDQMCLGK